MNNSKGCLTGCLVICLVPIVIIFSLVLISYSFSNPILLFILILAFSIIYSLNKRKRLLNIKNTAGFEEEENAIEKEEIERIRRIITKDKYGYDKRELKMRREQEKEKKIEERMGDITKDIEDRKKLLIQLKERLKVNKNPDRIEEYKDIAMEIYEFGQKTTAIQILHWDEEPDKYSGIVCTNIEELHGDLTSLKRYDLIKVLDEKTKELEDIGFNTFYFDLTEAKNFIDWIRPLLKKDKEEFLAQKELELRKKESTYFLAEAYRQRKKKTIFKQNLSTVDNLLKLTPIEFEKWVKANIFEKEGWLVSETKATGDGGIDLVLTKNGEHSIAQCKRFKNTVGEPVLRDFYGTIVSEGVSRGFFVTTGMFSLSALKFAENKPIVLIDRRILAQRLGGDKYE